MFDLDLLEILLNWAQILVVWRRVGDSNTEMQYHQKEGFSLGSKVNKYSLNPQNLTQEAGT